MKSKRYSKGLPILTIAEATIHLIYSGGSVFLGNKFLHNGFASCMPLIAIEHAISKLRLYYAIDTQTCN